MGAACMVMGFALAITGLALWSVPLACVVAGAMLFVSGGIEMQAREQRARTRAAKITTT